MRSSGRTNANAQGLSQTARDLRILVAEDSSSTLDQLCEFLQEAFPFANIDRARTVAAGHRLIEATSELGARYDVVAIDSRLPIKEGEVPEIDESLCLAVKSSFPNAYVVHMTAYENDPTVVRHLFRYHLEPGDGHTSLCCKGNVAWPVQLLAKIQAVSSGDVLVEGDGEGRSIERPDLQCDSEGQKSGFDVFLCHNSEDKPLVRRIAQRLRSRGVRPWLDVEQLRPGVSWQAALEEQISTIRSAAVFVGKSGLGPWQNQELRAFLSEFVKRGCPVIPVILGDCPVTPHIPIFLREMTWVDFRVRQPNPIGRLLWGITGRQQ